jgi:ketosteroid isomerase-like protein
MYFRYMKHNQFIMMRYACVVISAILFLHIPITQAQSSLKQIEHVLQTQQNAWNQGDIAVYMQGYWKSDSLTFIGKKGITKGWQHTLDNYKKSYPDATSMGKLSFDIITIEVLSDTHAYVVGKWHLQRAESKGNLQGHFTLLFQKIKGTWFIVSDHSS